MALTDNLIAAWELNEASGDAVDSHGSNTLTDTNTVATGTGLVYGTARDFERDNSEYFTINDNTDLSTGDIDFTIEAWVYLESKAAGNQVIVGKDSGTNGEFYLYRKNTGDAWTFAVYGATAFGSGTVLEWGTGTSTGTWVHLIAWHDAGANTVNIVKDNGTPTSTSHSAGVIDGTGTFRIGNDSFGDYWDGMIGPVRFWKRVLTSDERTQLYNGGAGLTYANFAGGAGNPTGAHVLRGGGIAEIAFPVWEQSFVF